MEDSSYIAFFEAPNQPFKFINQHDFDLHIALEVSYKTLMYMFKKGQEAGIETRGISITIVLYYYEDRRIKRK